MITSFPLSFLLHFIVLIRGVPLHLSEASHFPPPGLYLDAEAGLDFLLMRRDIDRRKIILFGRSLGGAVAIYLAASHPHMDKSVSQ